VGELGMMIDELEQQYHDILVETPTIPENDLDEFLRILEKAVREADADR
jgi:hypothetical protein